MKEIKLRDRSNVSSINLNNETMSNILDAMRSRQASRRAAERPVLMIPTAGNLTERYKGEIPIEPDNPLTSLQLHSSRRALLDTVHT